jgi:hypothetical protein
MTKQDFNQQVQQHLGSLQGIDETMPTCDKPCNVHAATQAKQAHQIAVLALLAQYVGNGIADEIADKTSDRLERTILDKIDNRIADRIKASAAADTSKHFTIRIPRTGKVYSVAKAALSTWAFRAVLLLTISWFANGKIDKDAIKDILNNTMKSQQTQTLSKMQEP